MGQFVVENAHLKIDREKYAENYERIFGEKKEEKKEDEMITELTKEEKAVANASYEAGQISMVKEIRELEARLAETQERVERRGLLLCEMDVKLEEAEKVIGFYADKLNWDDMVIFDGKCAREYQSKYLMRENLNKASKF